MGRRHASRLERRFAASSEDSELKKSSVQSVRHTTARLRKSARIRADEEARRIPWQILEETRNRYIDWQEFCFWARSIIETENGIPDWLGAVLQTRCPGFLEMDRALTSKAARRRPIALRLEDWIEDHMFDCAKREGWFFAVTYYAVRDPRYQRAEVCWSECVEKWKKAKPIRYPSVEEWKSLAEQCDETAHLVAVERKARASSKLVGPDRLAEAVARYIDYEALAYWAHPALERGAILPPEVLLELQRVCPGYVEARQKACAKTSRGGAQGWEHLMLWVGNHFFQNAKAEGWFDAILIQVRSHPRAIRTNEFADHCDELWGDKLPSPYPLFEDWRKEADSFVDLD
jgi:hypothetical protein